jgi:MFS family permease
MTVRALRMTPARVLSQFLDRSLLGSPGWRVAVTGQLLYAVPFAVITVFGALMARVAFGATPAMAQLAFTAFFVTSFAARTGVVWRTPIARKLRLLWLSGGLTAVGLILLGFGHGLGLLLVAMSVLGVPHGITFPIALAQAAESSNPAGLARANAGLLAAMGLTSVVAPPIMGGLLPATGYRGMMLLLLIPVGILASLLWMQRDYPGSVTDFPQVGQVKS